MKKTKLFSVACAGLLLLFCMGCQNAPPERKSAGADELFLSAAASLTDAMKEIGALYERENPARKIVCNFGGSGALKTQIEQGAPVDLFIAAAEQQMDELEAKGLILKQSRRDLLVNQVVLIAATDDKSGVGSFEEAANAARIALGEPQGVPVGQYARQIFSHLQILPEIEAKAVYGADVRQVLAWVENKEAQVGVVYATDAALSDKVRVICQAPPGSHAPVVYPAAITSGGKHGKAAEQFMAFLQTPAARAVFEKYGFKVE